MTAPVRRARRALPLIVALMSLSSLGSAAAAWPVAPRDGAADRPDLAAMTLDLDDMPKELSIFEYQDFFYRPDWFAAGYAGTPTTPEEVLATGLRRHYESSYRSPDDRTRVRSYALEFGSPQEVAAGFALFEDEAQWSAAFAPESEVHDLPEDPGIGEEPREISVGVLRFPVCCDLQTVDVTFRVGPILAGVAVEAPDYADAPDQQLALDLARMLERRVRSVLAGELPPGIDPAIRGAMLPIAEIWPAQGIVPEGYLTVDEALGEQKPLVGFREDYQGGYARTIAPDELTGSPGLRPLFVSVAVIKLDNPLIAETVLKLSEFLPRPAPLQLFAWEPAEAPEVAGTEFAAALTGPRWADAYQVAFVVGHYLARVWVEGIDEAQAIALDLAAQQAACLAAGGICNDLVVPPAFATSAEQAG